MARAADDAIVLDFADEQSVVQTRFATTALALLRELAARRGRRAAADAAARSSAPLPVIPRPSSSGRSSAAAGPSASRTRRR